MSTELLDNYPKYDSYKDSSVDWLGEIPSHWQVWNSKWLFASRKEKAQENDEQLTASQKYGVIPQKLFMDLEGRKVTTVFLNHEILKHVKKGDFVISMRSFQGGIEYCDYQGSVSSAYVPLIPNDTIYNSFYKFLLKSKRYIEALQSTSNLVRDGQALRYDNFCMVPLVLIPLKEQKAIADFLDTKTSQIDQAIELKQQQIEKLDEYKQITIQNAVTKGLNANAKMKYSGVDWIGDIPEHWAVNPGMNIFSENKRSNKGLIEDTVLSLSYGEIIIKPLENMFGLMPESFETYQIINPNDIIIRCMDLQNDKKSLRTGISRYRGIITSAYLCLRVDDNYSAKFFYHYIHSLDTTKIIYKFGSGLRQNLSFRDFRRMPVVVPPIDEQILIVNKIQDVTDSIERTVLNQKKQIERLKEYKTILINQAVTGKIKVS